MAGAQVRVLQAVMAVSIGALAFKAVDVAQAFTQKAEQQPPHPTAEVKETPLTAGVTGLEPSGPNAGPAPNEAPPAAGAAKPDAAAESCVATRDFSEAGVTAQEVNVLRSLAQRRKD